MANGAPTEREPQQDPVYPDGPPDPDEELVDDGETAEELESAERAPGLETAHERLEDPAGQSEANTAPENPPEE